VTVPAHPLCGELLAASAFRRFGGVLHLVVELPDGSPGTIRADATDVLATAASQEPQTVLDAGGVRALRLLVTAMGDAGRGGRGAEAANRFDLPLFAPTTSGR
jgi:hypothetical protein